MSEGHLLIKQKPAVHARVNLELRGTRILDQDSTQPSIRQHSHVPDFGVGDGGRQRQRRGEVFSQVRRRLRPVAFSWIEQK